MMNITVSAEAAREMDRQAHDEWGMNHFALIEAAGQRCAEVFSKAFPRFFDSVSNADAAPRIAVFAGSGNNGADALCMLKTWLLSGKASPASAVVFACKAPPQDASACDTPLDSLLFTLSKMKVPGTSFDAAGFDLVIDGIAGTGVRGALEGVQAAMVQTLNALAETQKPFVVSVDVPSGLCDTWKAGMPIVCANATLAIEPRKTCLYNPAARSAAGLILPVRGIFPDGLLAVQKGPELLDWESAKSRIPHVKPDTHKYGRGCVEIHAGSPGAVGAAVIAARGSQAAGAGLTRLVVDEALYAVAAAGAFGIMVSTMGSGADGRFMPDAVLVGPGWGRGPGRAAALEALLALEKSGTPLVLDADGIHLARDAVFHGNALLTPHAGEFAAYTGFPIEEILDNPFPLLRKVAAEKNAFLLLKSHCLFIAAPDGRCGIIDGMSPNCAAGGSGDLLAGFCVAIAARAAKNKSLDLYDTAAAAACLFMRAGTSDALKFRFVEPAELADAAATIAGKAWLAPQLSTEQAGLME